ncbi:UDP-glucose--hexose-1-phosphate uridylyltransferase [Paracoccus sp. (in: a-proteobacteria)]|uniref:UDP-glucose--hexose-1-phosphate uridylyltransferase n=1 Tax=Paracoccus sp. TaxID=267 RepID=UPI003A889687
MNVPPPLTETFPHRRLNPLTGDWVLVSPQRGNRPWQGQQEDAAVPAAPAHDPACFLCPGNTRVTGDVNAGYRGPFVFPNDFPAILPDAPAIMQDSPLFRAAPVRGEARVICYSERHDLTMARLPVPAIRKVIDCWVAQYAELSDRHDWVEIFENRGAAMGCSNPHPHGQIWATDSVPSLPAREDATQRDWLVQHGCPMLRMVAEQEIARGERVVFQTAEWLCIVPWWAVWPFETLLLPLFPATRLTDLTPAQRDDLALALSRLTIRYDNLFGTDFPYSMGWHGAPGRDDAPHWTLHAHVFPPLLRSATVRKFMVGYELMAEAQRDLTPEKAAALLRAQSDTHYLNQSAESGPAKQA